VQVSTTSDNSAAVSSNPYTVVPSQQVSNVNATISGPSNAAGALTGYTVSFTTSSTGGLAGVDNSSIAVTFPAGTGLTPNANSTDTTTGQYVANGYGSTVGNTQHIVVFQDRGVNPGDSLSISFTAITNPPAGTYSVQVSTTSDNSASVSSNTYTVVPSQQVSNVSASISGPSNEAGATTSYTVSFTTSSTGGLAGVDNSNVAVTFPAGTGMPDGASMTDTTTGAYIGNGYGSVVGNTKHVVLFPGLLT
jgi:hypothetical protein